MVFAMQQRLAGTYWTVTRLQDSNTSAHSCSLSMRIFKNLLQVFSLHKLHFSCISISYAWLLNIRLHCVHIDLMWARIFLVFLYSFPFCVRCTAAAATLLRLLFSNKYDQGAWLLNAIFQEFFWVFFSCSLPCSDCLACI